MEMEEQNGARRQQAIVSKELPLAAFQDAGEQDESEHRRKERGDHGEKTGRHELANRKVGARFIGIQEAFAFGPERTADLASRVDSTSAQMYAPNIWPERPDGFKIPGSQALHGAELEAFGDHRIAMAFSVAALRAQGDTLIRGCECAAISYPQFFPVLEGLVER